MCSLTATYGPNHREDEPDEVVVHRGDIRKVKDVDRAPIPPALLEQRRAINFLAASTLRPCTSAGCQR